MNKSYDRGWRKECIPEEEDAVQRDTDTVTLVDEEEEEGAKGLQRQAQMGKDGAGVTPRGSEEDSGREAGPAGGTCRGGDEAGEDTFF